MVAYVASVLVASVLTEPNSKLSWSVLWWVLPVLATAFVLRAAWRYVQRIDEYQRQLQLESLAIAFGVTMLAAITLGLLTARVDTGMSVYTGIWTLYGIGMIAWAIAARVRGAR
jgi:ABC-type transport system involved in multi-copper enzyme maturation permease subunit